MVTPWSTFMSDPRRAPLPMTTQSENQPNGTLAAPAFLDRLLASRAWEGQMTGEPGEASRRDNLFEPVPGDQGEEGSEQRESGNVEYSAKPRWQVRVERIDSDVRPLEQGEGLRGAVGPGRHGGRGRPVDERQVLQQAEKQRPLRVVRGGVARARRRSRSRFARV